MVRDDNTKSTYFILGLILVAGFLLRIYKLSSQSIWLDEAYSIYHSQRNFMHVTGRFSSGSKKINENKFWLIVSSGAYNGETQSVLNYLSDNYTETDSREYVLNHNPALVNRLFRYFKEKGLIHLNFNRIKIAHFQKKQKDA